jgi:hypothetical protein
MNVTISLEVNSATLKLKKNHMHSIFEQRNVVIFHGALQFSMGVLHCRAEDKDSVQ